MRRNLYGTHDDSTMNTDSCKLHLYIINFCPTKFQSLHQRKALFALNKQHPYQMILACRIDQSFQPEYIYQASGLQVEFNWKPGNNFWLTYRTWKTGSPAIWNFEFIRTITCAILIICDIIDYAPMTTVICTSNVVILGNMLVSTRGVSIYAHHRDHYSVAMLGLCYHLDCAFLTKGFTYLQRRSQPAVIQSIDKSYNPYKTWVE